MKNLYQFRIRSLSPRCPMQSRRYGYSECSKSFKISLDSRKPGKLLRAHPGFLAIYTEVYSVLFTNVNNHDDSIVRSTAGSGKLNFVNLAISRYSWEAALKVNSDTHLGMLAAF